MHEKRQPAETRAEMASSAKAELLAASAAQDILALVDLFERNGARKDELDLGDVLATLSSKESAKLWEGLEKAAMSVLRVVFALYVVHVRLAEAAGFVALWGTVAALRRRRCLRKSRKWTRRRRWR